MFLELHGAADGVTGSLHRVHVQGRDLALDCGLFQGRREESSERNRALPAWARSAHALILSHAHLDHAGNLPGLVRHGFRGNVYATPATRDLASVMLRDSAMIQAQDAAYLEKRARKEGRTARIEPLYEAEHVAQAMSQMLALPLHRPLPIAPGATLTFFDAGHVLGSSLVVLDLEEGADRVRLLFTGDLGREELPLLGAPEIVDGVDALLMECTYGDRTHPPLEDANRKLAAIIRETAARGGRVYIPSFALERAQELLFALGHLKRSGEIPDLPIFVDSPLAIAVTEIYKLHPEALDPAIRDQLLGREDPFSPEGLRYVSDISASQALQATHEPAIIIAGSGMCEGGRILHHLARVLGDAKHSVVLVGFQAQHTLGRRLAEGRREVRVFGVEREVWCQVHQLAGLSAHADQRGLLEFARATARRGHLGELVLVHGEDDAKHALADRLKAEVLGRVTAGTPGQVIQLVPGPGRRGGR